MAYYISIKTHKNTKHPKHTNEITKKYTNNAEKRTVSIKNKNDKMSRVHAKSAHKNTSKTSMKSCKAMQCKNQIHT